MDSSSKKPKKNFNQGNFLESLKESTTNSLKNDLFKESVRDIKNQLLGMQPQHKFEGEIRAGESIVMDEVVSGEQEKRIILERQIVYERRLREEDRTLVETKHEQLRVELQAVMVEIQKLAAEMPELDRQVKIATLQAPVEPGQYHLIFFENLLKFLKSFRKKIKEAGVWLAETNRRASKKNAWGSNYKKYKGKYLLSSEHYLSRSAG